MKRTITLTALSLLMVLAGPALGQDEGTAFDEEGGFEGGSNQQQDQSGSGGQQAQPSPGTGGGAGAAPGRQQRGQAENVTTETYKDWTVRCGEVPNQGERCEMSQKVKAPNNPDQTAMRVAVLYPQGSDRPAGIFQLPLGIVLPKGVAMKVDDNDAVRFPVQICVKQGCRADVPLKSKLLNQMKAGRTAYVQVQTPRAKSGTVQLEVSLLGFTAALQRVQEAR